MNNFIIKYTPKDLNEHSFNREALQLVETLIKENQPTMMLIGDEGCGKTTIIDNIIKRYYEGYSHELVKSNIMRICCLKDQGTTFCRNELKIFCQVNTCIPYRKKIVRMDNLDLVNEQNQHIFRSFIDKYKNNVSFLCSANHAQKIIDQIQSRIILVKLNVPAKKDMLVILKTVCECEKISINKSASEQIIKLSRNSVTRMLNYLEKMVLSNLPMTKRNINDICDGINHEHFDQFTKFSSQNNYILAIKLILDIYNNGYSSIDIFDEYYHYVKVTDIIQNNDKHNIIIALCEYMYKFYESDEHEIQLIFFTKRVIEILHSENNLPPLQ